VQTLVIDPVGEYVRLASELGGQVLRLSAGPPHSPCRRGIAAGAKTANPVEVRLSDGYSLPEFPSLERLRMTLAAKGL